MEALGTDDLLNMYENLYSNNKNRRGFMENVASHGLDYKAVQRTLACMCSKADQVDVLEIAAACFGLGLQVGAMRLDPVEPPEEGKGKNCTCIACTMARMLGAEFEEGEGPHDA